MNQRVKILEDYTKSLGVHVQVNESSIVPKWVEMSLEDVKDMTMEQCGDAVFSLRQYAYYIQQQQNQEKVRKRFLEAELNGALCDVWNDYDSYTPKDLKVRGLAKKNPAINEILTCLDYAEDRLNSLFRISDYIVKLTDAINGVKFGKQRRVKDEDAF